MSDPNILCNNTTPFSEKNYALCCPPELNSDVGGLGVRLSFYLQALFLACLSARSDSLDEITGSLYTLVATNVAMTVTAFILGFKGNAEITLQDTIVVLYLLSLSWVTVVFCLPSFNRFFKSDPILKYLSVAQSFILFGFSFAVLIKANGSFGSMPICNSGTRVVFFGNFRLLPVGRILALIATTIVLVVYTTLTTIDYYPLIMRQRKHICDLWNIFRKARGDTIPSGTGRQSLFDYKSKSDATSDGFEPPKPVSNSGHRKSEPSAREQTSKATGIGSRTERGTPHRGASQDMYDLDFSGNIIIEALFICIVWSMVVMNTELLIQRNDFKPSGSSQWQFGQILPVFLVILPLINLIKAFKRLGFSRRDCRNKRDNSHSRRSPGCNWSEVGNDAEVGTSGGDIQPGGMYKCDGPGRRSDEPGYRSELAGLGESSGGVRVRLSGFGDGHTNGDESSARTPENSIYKDRGVQT